MKNKEKAEDSSTKIISMPTATTQSNLLLLRHPTKEELTYIRTLHAECWAGPLSVSQYLTREDHIASTNLTRDGGITQWVLVDRTATHLHVLASCEAIQKQAVISHPSVDGEKGACVKDVIAYGVGSVFTPPECRGKGYARIMLTMLGERLKFHNGEMAGFSALYSDIGKEFYAKLGWLPHRSSHIDIPVPAADCKPSSRVQPLYRSNIAALCEVDIAHLRSILSARYAKPRVAFLPDHGSMDWHHNREEFIAGCIRPTFGKPEVKGCVTADGKRWVIWGRDFSLSGPKLYVLRIVDLGGDEEREEDMVVMLGAAMEEARRWELGKVCIWNPERCVVEAARRVAGDDVRVVDRETESIASLMMYGEEIARSEVEWFVNEKFAWC